MGYWPDIAPDSYNMRQNTSKAVRRLTGEMTLTLVLAALAGALLSPHSLAQVRGYVAKDVRIPAETFDPPNQDRVKTLIRAKQARPTVNNDYLAELLTIETFKETGDPDVPEMVMEAPNCTFDNKTHDAHSAGPLKIHSTNPKLEISGTGFLWQKVGTNSILTISNQVHATIQVDALTGTNSSGTKAGSGNSTNQLVEIYSDTFTFDRGANVIKFTGHARGDNEQMNLACDEITVRRGSSRVERIEADRQVVITTRETGGKATGDHAIYSMEDRRLVLTGDPFYSDGTKEATGRRFYFDQVQRTMQAEGDAHFKMPRNALNQGGFLAGAVTPAPTNAANAGTEWAEIFADVLWLQLPPSTGSVQRVMASNHVIILDPAKRTRATAGRASFEESTGVLELMDRALWEGDQRVARAELLRFDRNQQSFAALTNAYLRFPISSIGTNQGNLKAGGATNQFIEVIAGDYVYGSNLLTFHEQVKAGFMQGDWLRGTLEAGSLQVEFTTNNQLHGLLAEGAVYGRMMPFTNASGKILDRDLRCETLKLSLQTNGTVQEVVAETQVHASQTELGTNSPLPVRLALEAASVKARFFPLTNAVESAEAEGNVVLAKDDSKALGDRLLYSGTNDLARLLGNPRLVRPGISSTQDQIVYDHARGSFVFGDGGKVQIRINVAAAKAGKTNLNRSGPRGPNQPVIP